MNELYIEKIAKEIGICYQKIVAAHIARDTKSLIEYQKKIAELKAALGTKIISRVTGIGC